MRYGCLASGALWLAVAAFLFRSPALGAIALLYVVAVVTYRGLHSDWPLY